MFVSVYHTKINLDRYIVRNTQGIVSDWNENLSEAKEKSRALYLDKDCFIGMQNNENRYGYLNNENISDIISVNYEGKTLEELSEADMESLLQIRSDKINENLMMDSKNNYTDTEIARFMDKAGDLSVISMGYSEGWKVLAENMGGFGILLNIVITVLILPLFGRDSGVQMEELVRSARFGQKRLNLSRILSAYLAATVLYFASMMIYFNILMMPFGFEGGNQPIQSNVRAFFSLYNITYLQQFMINLLVGYLGLIFMVSAALMVTIILKNLLASASLIAIFYIMLIVIDQLYVYEINHWFANFMPVHMTEFWHFYTGNELYRIWGRSIPCLNWSIIVSLILSAIFLAIGILVLLRDKICRIYLKKGSDA
jgi:hypothetical protein